MAISKFYFDEAESFCVEYEFSHLREDGTTHEGIAVCHFVQHPDGKYRLSYAEEQ